MDAGRVTARLTFLEQTMEEIADDAELIGRIIYAGISPLGFIMLVESYERAGMEEPISFVSQGIRVTIERDVLT